MTWVLFGCRCLGAAIAAVLCGAAATGWVGRFDPWSLWWLMAFVGSFCLLLLFCGTFIVWDALRERALEQWK